MRLEPAFRDGASTPLIATDHPRDAGGPIEWIGRLVPIQFGILYGCLADASGGVYRGQWRAVVDGALDVPSLARAWQDLVLRHAILRTAFDWEGRVEPLQAVLRDVGASVALEDLSALNAEAQARRIADFLADDLKRGFDLKRPPLMRLAALRCGIDRHVLVWSRHHLVCDGWSLAVLFGELFTTYAALRRGVAPELPPALPFARYVQWWRRRDRGAVERYWAGRLAGSEFGPPAPAAARGEFRETVRTVAAGAVEELRAGGRAHRVTLNTLAQGAWALVLERHRARDEVVFGITAAVRPEVEEGVCLGPQIATLPLRVDGFAEDPGTWLRGIQAAASAARQHARASLPEIAASCGLREGRALFDSALVFQNYPTDGADLPDALGLAIRDVVDVSTPDLPLTLVVEPGTTLVCRLIHDREQFGDAVADGMLDGFVRAIAALAEAGVKAGAAPVSALDVRPDLLPSPAAPRDPSDRTVLHLLQDAPRQACALVCGGERLTYGALIDRSRAVGAAVASRFGRGRRIGLAAAQTPASVVALLGIQWGGCAYVPLDPALPSARLAAMAADAGLAAIVLDPSVASADLGAAGTPLVRLDALEGGCGADAAPPAPSAEAYVVFTSGSTGRPKGVVVTHQNLLASVAARPAVYPERVERLLLTFPLFFDGSVLGLFSTLAAGGTLVLPDPVPDPASMADPVGLCRVIARESVTHTVMVPGLHAALLDAAAPGDLASLVACGVAGEACPPALLRRHLSSVPHAALINEYGPTEATVWAAAHRCTREDVDGPVPIGAAVPGYRLHLLDRRHRPVPRGATGEIFIGGDGVAAGYVGDPALTAERFLADPWSTGPGARLYRTGDLAAERPDGALVFLGRSDRQLKLRGHRVEPEEIEATLLRADAVAEAAVVLRGEAGREKLVAYAAPRPGHAIDAASLRAGLAAGLPAVMVPEVVLLPALPRLPSGKLDRDALPAPDIAARGPSDARGDARGDVPRDADEAALAAVWAEVLGRATVPPTGDFFALGGDSMLGMRTVALMRARLGAAVELHHLLRHPTVRELAPVLHRLGPVGGAAIARRERRRGGAD